MVRHPPGMLPSIKTKGALGAPFGTAKRAVCLASTVAVCGDKERSAVSVLLRLQAKLVCSARELGVRTSNASPAGGDRGLRGGNLEGTAEGPTAAWNLEYDETGYEKQNKCPTEHAGKRMATFVEPSEGAEGE